MAADVAQYRSIIEELQAEGVTLVAVSKTKPVADIRALYEAGQRDFGENYVQELTEKQAELPADIRWHFIGHLQGNKVKYIAPFVHLVHGVDSLKLLREINKQAGKHGRMIDCLLQVHIAEEETKFGMDESEISEVLDKLSSLPNVKVCGLMGMASFTSDAGRVRQEFHYLHEIYVQSGEAFAAKGCPWSVLSMGMSGDYRIAMSEGSTMVRIGSLLFGSR